MKFKYSILASLLLSACGGQGHYLDEPSDFRQPDNNQPVSSGFAGRVNGNYVDISPFSKQEVSEKTITKPSASEQELINRAITATNELRAEAGLAPLRIDDTLTAYATIRAQEIYSTFSHYRLDDTYALFYTYFKGRGSAGENLANGKSSPEQIVKTALRNSPTHYANMTHPNFSHIGIGVYFDQLTQRYYWAQIFATENVDSVYTLADKGGLSASRVQRALYDASNHQNQRLNITAPEKNPNAYQNDLSALYGNTAYVIELEDNRQIVMKKNNQWKHQTIGEILENKNTLAYLNLGSAYSPQANTDFTATYTGQVLGDLSRADNQGNVENKGRVSANLEAQVTFNGTNKHLTINVKDAQFNGAPDNQYNFSERLNWDNNQARFQIDEKNFARLYGANAEEIGGQFEKEVQGDTYRGVYGGARP